MNHLEIEECLKSMIILVDTREQPNEKAHRRWESFGVPYRRQTLRYGDYTYNFRLPSGEMLFPEDVAVGGDCVIERKMSLVELSGNFCHERKRFANEFEAIKTAEASVYLLVENASWENLINGRYKTGFNPIAYEASIEAWMARYGAKPIFCKSETSGHLIKNILYRELKERLECGFYG